MVCDSQGQKSNLAQGFVECVVKRKYVSLAVTLNGLRRDLRKYEVIREPNKRNSHGSCTMEPMFLGASVKRIKKHCLRGDFILFKYL